MTVSTFDPAKLQIQMSDAAVTHITQQLASSNHKVIRLVIKESGCSGYMYELEYADSPQSGDLPVRIGSDLDIYVDGKYLTIINNTQVDYITEGLNSTLRFKNPNAHSECGCGESFSL